MPSTTRTPIAFDLDNLPTSILIELYTVAVNGVVTEMHKAMQARHETMRRTGYRRAAEVSGSTEGQPSSTSSDVES